MHDALFRNRFRISSTRLPGWDYSRGGTYCVTICTLGRVCWFGEVVEGEMVLSDLGKIVAEEWVEMARRRRYLNLDAWVVMPNHLHGILHFDQPRVNGKPRLLGQVIGLFKAACTSRIWDTGALEFSWQERFFDQIIRSEDALLRFRKYIQENPARWEKDKHHPQAP